MHNSQNKLWIGITCVPAAVGGLGHAYLWTLRAFDLVGAWCAALQIAQRALRRACTEHKATHGSGDAACTAQQY